MTLAANPDGNYGWQVPCCANPDDNYGWQVRVMTLAANPDGIYGAGRSSQRPLLSTLDGIYVSNSLAANMG